MLCRLREMIHLQFRRLKNEICMTEFTNRINQCEEAIYFITQEGHRINLSSMLSQIYFQVAYDPEKMENGGHLLP